MKAASSPTSRNGIQTAFQTIILIVLVDLSEFDEPETILNTAIAERDTDFVDDLVSYILESEFDEGYLSFSIIYALDGERLFCGSAFDYGIDPCSSAKIDFQSPLDTFLQRTVPDCLC